MVKKRMSICGTVGIIRDFLAYNFAKYQYFSMTRDQVYSISTITLQILCKFQLNIFENMDYMAEKPQKSQKISCISVCAFCSISITNIATPPTFFNIVTWILVGKNNYEKMSFLVKVITVYKRFCNTCFRENRKLRKMHFFGGFWL